MDYMISSVLAAATAATGDPNSVTTAATAAAGVVNNTWAIFGAMIGCGIVIVGAGIGIAMIGGRAADAIARQPEAGSRIFTSMIVAAALIEGVTFFALLICFLGLLWLKPPVV